MKIIGATNKKQSNMYLALIFIFITIASIVLILSKLLIDKTVPASNKDAQTFEDLTVFIESTEANSANISIVNKKGFFYITKDGVRFIDFDGNEKFNFAYNMEVPISKGEGDFLLIYEHKGNSLHLFSPNGEVYSKVFDFPIVNVSINSSGLTSVICQNTDEFYKPYIINESGEEIGGSFENYNIFPLTTDLSNDGKVQVISYLDINGSKLNSKIEYRSISTQDSVETNSNVDGVFAANDTNPDEILIMLEFMKNNNVIAISDKSIKCSEVQYINKYEYKHLDKWNVPLNNEINKIAFNDKKAIVVALGKGIVNKESEKEGTLKYYDLNGNVIWAYSSEPITYLSCSNGIVIIGTENEFIAFSENGNKLWNYTPPQKLNQIQAVDNNSFLVLSENKVSTVGLVK